MQPQNVAVVVVHGVADQSVGETARAVAGLLAPRCRLGALEHGFVELNDQEGRPFQVATFGSDSLDHHRRLKVFEVYWADLSRPAKSLFGMVAAFFEILSALPRHSLAELDAAQVKRSAPWLHGLLWAAWWLGFGLVLPCMYAGLGAAVALPLFGHGVHETWVATSLSVAAGSVLAVALLVWALARVSVNPSTPLSNKFGVGVIAIAGAGGGGYLAHQFPLPVAVVLFTAVWVLLGVRLFGGLGRSQLRAAAKGKDGVGEKEHPERRLVLAWTAIGVLTPLTWLVAAGIALFRDGRPIGDACLFGAMTALQLAYVGACSMHALASALFVLAAFSAGGWYVWLRLFNPRALESEALVSVFPALRTSVLAVGVALVAMVLLALPILSAVNFLLQSLLPTSVATPLLLESLHVYGDVSAADSGSMTVPVLVNCMIAAAGTSTLAYVLLCSAGFLVASLAYLVPPILASHSLRRRPKAHEAIAEWMDGGADALVWATFIPIQLALLVTGFAIEVLAAFHVDSFVPDWRLSNTGSSRELILAMGAGLAGSATFLAFPGRLKDLLLPVWPALDIVGDVKSYLEHDTQARILARCAAVLRHVAGQRFDRIVLIAHSQGSVVIFDALQRPDIRSLMGGRARLVTCGTPLAHLYHRFFPTRFLRLSHAVVDPLGELGVTRWTNLSGYGDYIGMSVSKTRLLADMKLTLDKALFADEPAGEDVVGHNQYFTPEATRVRARIWEALDADVT